MGDVFFPIAIAGTLLVLYVVGSELGIVVAIKGIYALLGLLVAATVYYRYTIDNPTRQNSVRHRQIQAAKILTILAGLSIAVTALTGSKLLGFLIILPIGYGLLAWQFLNEAPTGWLLAQIMGLFAMPPVLEYLTAGFYFGNGDLFKHVLYVEQLLAEGKLTAISFPYEYFPGLHLLVGAVSSITGLPPYDALFLVGILVYAESILVIYLLARVVFNTRLSPFLVAAAVTMLSTPSFYATYFYPQSLAIVLLLHVLLISIYANVFTNPQTLSAVALILGGAVIFTHHLSLVLFAPIFILFAIGGELMSGRGLINRDDASLGGVVEPRYIPAAVVGMAGIIYWTVLQVFVPALVTQALIITGQYSSPGSVKNIYRFDVPATTENVWGALSSLISPNGVYSIALATMFVLGLASYFDHYRRKRALGVILVGIAAAIFILPSPLGGKGFARIGHPMSFFFAFIIGGGLYYLVTVGRRAQTMRIMLVITMIILGTLGPVLAGDDVYRLYEERKSQKELSEGELAQLQAISAFSHQYSAEVATDWITTQAMTRYGQADVHQFTVTDTGIRHGRGLLAYRKRWAAHVVVMSNPQSQSRFYVSKAWLDAAIDRNSKVYAGGQVGATWSPESTVWSGFSNDNFSS